jgi:hypothetical protein
MNMTMMANSRKLDYSVQDFNFFLGRRPESVIDQVKLYAVVNGYDLPCPLVNAAHSRLGNVLLPLLFSDDWKTQTLLLETVDLTFFMPYQSVQGYVFKIEGCNMLKQ